MAYIPWDAITRRERKYVALLGNAHGVEDSFFYRTDFNFPEAAADVERKGYHCFIWLNQLSAKEAADVIYEHRPTCEWTFIYAYSNPGCHCMFVGFRDPVEAVRLRLILPDGMEFDIFA